MIFNRVIATGVLLLVWSGAGAMAAQKGAKFLSANNNAHYVWLNSRWVGKGNSDNHFAKSARAGGGRRGTTVPFGVTWAHNGKSMALRDLLSISSNDRSHFAWYLQKINRRDTKEGYIDTRPPYVLWVSSGSARHLNGTKQWRKSSLPARASAPDLRFVTSNNKRHFGWFFTRNNQLWVSAGSSTNLGKHSFKKVTLPRGVKRGDIRYMASNDDMHFAFLKNGYYIAGASNRLGSKRMWKKYDLHQLRAGRACYGPC